MASRYRFLWQTCLILGLLGISLGRVSAREHYVFAHFMVCMPWNNTVSVESYKQQIRLAQQYGIDGFALNCGSWTKDPYYVERSTMLYEAAKQLNSGFKLFFSIDTATALDPLPTALDMMARFAKHPNQFCSEGRPVLSAYSRPSLRWAETMSALKAAGYDVCFVPFLWTDNTTLAPSYDGVLNTLTDAPYLDGYFLFGIDAPWWDLQRGNANGRRATAKFGKLYMATNSFSYDSANVRDFHGMRDYCAIWEGLIRDNADWVELVTWNDYGEDSHLAPANGFGDLAYTDHDESFLDVTAYYAAWFKTGTPPAIRQEKLYYVYRNRSKWQTAAYDVQKKAWTQLPDQIHDDVEDKVYATTFLRTPAELTIQSGANRKTFKLAAGISHVELPFGPGVPHFQLRRQGKVLADVSGNQQIVDTPTEENSRLGYRYANKTWSGAWCLGQGACEYSCAMATCYQGATVVTEGGRRVVHMPASDGNGLRLALPSLAGGAYNVRLRYRNVQPNECRLSLTAAGATSNLFPVFLPPTASGAWHTVAFLWTLPDACTSLTLERKKGDLGEAFLDSIELAPVLPIVATPTPASTLPALTEIPGGAFRMGAEHGDPDEVPLHPVTVSPFRMGKCEVTNAEYERLAPEHKRYRDEYSWRDSDPVTYISWQQAALYCNWLSAQAGLSPAYNPKDWSVNLHAGYRLPTEAEWEYVASGRGEGRRYPWGKVAPDASRCNATGPGAMAVGSYPAGASRDGIMDLAGNVAEWCTDMYHAYTSAAVTDPCDLQPGPYRVIRGGSWGYYNRSQRVADREFNTQVYPGFYYVGFRVVLPHAAAPAQ